MALPAPATAHFAGCNILSHFLGCKRAPCFAGYSSFVMSHFHPVDTAASATTTTSTTSATTTTRQPSRHCSTKIQKESVTVNQLLCFSFSPCFTRIRVQDCRVPAVAPTGLQTPRICEPLLGF